MRQNHHADAVGHGVALTRRRGDPVRNDVGDWMWIETRRGRMKQRVKITAGIDPRVIAAQHGWWFPEEPAPDYGVWKSNVNLLTDNQPPYDPAMGTYQLRALLCRVAPVV